MEEQQPDLAAALLGSSGDPEATESDGDEEELLTLPASEPQDGGFWTSQLPIHRIALCCGELIISARCSSSVACARSTNRDRYSTFSSVLEGSSLVTEEIMNYNQRLQSSNSRAGKEPSMQSKYEMGTMLMTALFHKLSVKAVNVSLVPA